MSDDPTPLSATVHPLETRVLQARDRARAAGHPTAAGQHDPTEAIAERQRLLEREAGGRRARQQAEEVPTRYLRALPTNDRVSGWVRRTAAGGTDSLLILGPVGSGKTHEAFGAFRALVLEGYGRGDARWASVPAMLEGMRPGRTPVLSEAEAIACPLLLLDDLAAERGSEWTVEVLYRILDGRYAWMRPTIITTNVPPVVEEGGTTRFPIREQLGDRIASRLNGLGERVTIDHPDRRTGADRRVEP